MRRIALTTTVIVLTLAVFGARFWRTFRTGKIAVLTANRPETASRAPELILTDLSGETLNTSSLNGKVVVINFWAAWCTPCTEEVPSFIELKKKYHDRGLQVIGISMDDSESELRDFYRRAGMNYPVVVGSQKTAQAYGGILGLPTTFIIGRDGLIRRKLTGATDFAALEHEVVTMLGAGH
jgi:peroxiredoxin